MEPSLAAYEWDETEEALTRVIDYLRQLADLPVPEPVDLPDTGEGPAAEYQAEEPLDEEPGPVVEAGLGPWPATATDAINQLIGMVGQLADAAEIELALPSLVDAPEAEDQPGPQPRPRAPQRAQAQVAPAGIQEKLRTIAAKVNEIIARQNAVVQIPTPDRPGGESQLGELLSAILREIHRLGTLSVTGATLENSALGVGIGVHGGGGGQPPSELLAELPIEFGKLTADWTAGTNIVTIHPCDDDGSNEDTDTTITLYCTWPKDAKPGWVNLLDDDVVGYVPFYDLDQSEARGIIITAPVPCVCWGKATAAWTSGNTVTLDPCTAAGADNGLANVTGYLISPTGDTPGAKGLVYDIAENDILAYILIGENKGVIVNANVVMPAGDTNDLLYMHGGGKWTKLPLGTLYQVVQAKAGPAVGYDWVRLHG